MSVAQLSVLKYQLKPQIGLNATKKAVTGRPSRRRRISANDREARHSRRRKLKRNRASSHRRNSQSPTRFIFAVPSSASKCRDHARRSTGLVTRRQTKRTG